MNEHDTASPPALPPTDSWQDSSDEPLDLGTDDEGDPAFALLLRQTQHAVQQRVHGVAPEADEVQVFLGRYRVERLAGKGGMGTVLAAEDTWLERRVALKIVNTHGTRERRRLVREGVVLAKLSHPNVVQVHDLELGERGEHAYVVMEYVEGTTLAHWQAAERRTTEEILDKYRQAAQGLLAAHQVGIVHRDFKPHNVLVDAAGVVKVADFGLAGVSERELGSHDDEPPGSTRSGERSITAPHSLRATAGSETSLGVTPGYCAPEQLHGERPTARADQFAFCVALYQALTGSLPFGASRGAGEHEQAVTEGIAGRPEAAAIPRRVRRALARGLALRPDDRFVDMTALIAVLEPRAPRWPWIAAGLATAAAVLAVVLTPEAKVIEVEVDPCQLEDAELPLVAAPARAGGGSTGAQAFVDERAVAFRSAWKDASEGLCRAKRRNEVPDAAHAQAQACLDTAARELELVVGFVTAEGSTTDPFRAFASLRSPRLCVLGGGRPIYGAADPALQQELDQVRALQLQGRNDEALPRARALLERAQQAGDVAILAQASFMVGKLEIVMLQTAEASRDLEAAAIHAEALGDDVLALDAYAELVDIAANRTRDPAEGSRWERLADAKLRRARAHDSEVAGQYYSAVGNLAYRQGRFEDAIAHGERARGLLASTVGEEGLATLMARTNRAAALVAAGRPQEAIGEYEQVLEIRRPRYGARHPNTVRDELSLAYARMVAGQRREALAAFAQVEALATPPSSLPLSRLQAEAVVRQCEILVVDEAYDQAGPVCDRAYAMAPQLAGDERDLVGARGILLSKQALMLAVREQLEPALAVLEQEHATWLSVQPENAAMLANNASIRCVVLDALGRTPECAELLVQERRWYEASGRLAQLTRAYEELGLTPPDPQGATGR